MGAAILTEVGRQALHNNGIVWATLTMRLFTAPGAVDTETVLADLTEASFSGYNRQFCVFGAPAVDVLHRSVRTMTTLRFQHDGGGTPNTVKGWCITATELAGAALYVVKLLEEGDFTFAALGDFLDVDLVSRITQA